MNDMRLGDLDEALRMIKDSRKDNPYVRNVNASAWRMAHDSAISCVEAVPTIDAVPVVRCKDCYLHGECMTEDAFHWSGIQNPYCAVGKKRDDT